MDPFYICTDPGEFPDRRLVMEHLPAYIDTVSRMASKYEAVHVRTNAMFHAMLEHYEPEHFCPEPVHPTATGHIAIAHEWLRVVGW